MENGFFFNLGYLKNMIMWYFPNLKRKCMICGVNFWLDIFDFRIYIHQAILWLSVWVFCKISLLIHFILTFLEGDSPPLWYSRG